MRVVVVPPVLALLPEYAGTEDPVAELRAAVVSAVAWLGEGADDVRVVAADAQGERIAAHLLESSRRGTAPRPHQGDGPVLVLANGSARRTERAPGHLDERSHAFDDVLGGALAAGDVTALAGTDQELATELWSTGTGGFATLAGLRVEESTVDYDDDPYGVAYWVVRWTCAS